MGPTNEDASLQSEKLLVLTWRVTALEKRHQETMQQLTRQLEEQRVTGDAVIHQLRNELHKDYLTADQTQISYISRSDLRKQTKDHRDYILYLIAIGQLALGIYLALHG